MSRCPTLPASSYHIACRTPRSTTLMLRKLLVVPVLYTQKWHNDIVTLGVFLQNGTTYCKRRVCPVLDCAATEHALNGTMTSSNDVTSQCCPRCSTRKRRCAHARTQYKVMHQLYPAITTNARDTRRKIGDDNKD